MDETEQVAIEETPVQEAVQETPEVNQEAVEKRAEELYQARNFKMLRERTESEMKRAEAAERAAEAAIREANALRQKYETQGQQGMTNVEIGADDIVEGKHLAQQRAYIDQRDREYREKMAALDAKITNYHIKSSCPDFDLVVTNENLKKLAQDYPEIAATISTSTDDQAKAISAYKLIKKLNIDNTQTEVDRELIAKNINKPKPSNSLPKSESDLTRVNAFEKGITDAEREAIYKRTRDYAKMA